MKKYLAVILCVIMVLSLGISAFATQSPFVPNYDVKEAKEYKQGGWTIISVDELIVTRLANRKHPETNLQNVINRIQECLDMADNDLEGSLDRAANYTGIKKSDLMISEVFDITRTNLEEGHLIVTIKGVTAENFVCLIQKNCHGDGWFEITNISFNGDELTFETPSLCSFAIISLKPEVADKYVIKGGKYVLKGTTHVEISEEEDTESPVTGTENVTGSALVFAGVITASAVIFRKKRKH